MSGISNSWSRCFVLTPADPAVAGTGSFDLGDGQPGLFITESIARGAKAVTSAIKPNSQYFIEVGTNIPHNQGGASSKGLRTHWFSPKDVEEVTFGESVLPTQAQVYLGYDGLDKTKTLKLGAGESAEVSLTLTGEVLAFYGFRDGKYTGTFVTKADEADDCQETCLDSACHDRTLALIKQIKAREIRAGITLGDLIDVNPVIDCENDDTGTKTSANFYCLELCDAGDDAAQGLVQAQVPGFSVLRDSYVGTTSTYKVLGGAAAPSAFTDHTIAIRTVCTAACPAGFTSLGSGWYTAIKVFDDGDDDAAAILVTLEAVYTAAIVTSVTKVSGTNDTGKYVVLFTEEVDLDDVPGAVTVLQDIEEVKDLCVLTTPATTAWTSCGTCETSVSHYYIDIEDDDCGSRLADLRAAFPTHVIVQDVDLATAGTPIEADFDGVGSSIPSESSVIDECRRRYWTEVITNVVCTECHPDSFTTEAPTSFEFEEWFKYTVLGGGVSDFTISAADAARTAGTYTAIPSTSDGNGSDATFTVVIDSVGAATVTIVTAGKTYQVGDLVTISVADIGVTGSNLVLTLTEIVAPAASVDCVCGIYFKGKDIELCPDKDLADGIGTIKSQIEIQVSGGELLGTRIGYKYKTDGQFPQTRVSRAFDGTGWGKDFWMQEKEAYDYGLGIVTGNSTEERFFRNMRTKLEPCKQYDTITVKIKNSALSQAFSQTKTEYLRYIYIFEKGAKNIFESFFNDVASGNPDAQVNFE